ncbi:MAG: DUF4345 family protein [Bacteroidia bacterium]|nr:DUF4345 family protein [Bacteroidia bacterium]
MEDNKVVMQVQAIFRFFMALFYLGAGTFLLFFAKNFQINKALLNLVGGTFLFYGIYRIYRASVSIYKLFFAKENNPE